MTELIPGKEPQRLRYGIWSEYTPEKLELIDGEALYGGEQRDRMLLMLVYNTGLEHLVNMLPKESVEELKRLLENR